VRDGKIVRMGLPGRPRASRAARPDGAGRL